jgi:hypothetical protein
MSFAALEARLNASVFKHLANVRVSLGGTDVDGIFTNNYAVSGGGIGMATTAPALRVPTASVPANPIGTAVTVAAQPYDIMGHEPDGTGFSVLILERTS